MIRTVVLGTVLLAILALNPVFGCLANRFQYTEADMKRVIEGHWKLTVETRELDMKIRESGSLKRHASSGFVNSVSACGTRSFVNTADACVDDSAMDVDVVIAGVTNQGTFRVFGTTFERGTLEVEVGGLWLDAHFDATGHVLDVRATQRGNQVTATLARM